MLGSVTEPIMTPTSLEVPSQAVPNLQDVVISDGRPVDNILSEKNMRLLTEPLYASWEGPGDGRSFAALADVGLFYTLKRPPVVPGVMLSLDVDWPEDLSQKENNSYFVWIVGKLPDAVVEIVSNREGGEDSTKMRTYARINIPYYVIFDPEDQLGGGVLRAFELQGRKYRPVSPEWIDQLGLGLALWQGTYEGKAGTWLRWCDRNGQAIPTGAERAEQADRRAEQADRRAEQAVREAELLRARLRELGMEPPA